MTLKGFRTALINGVMAVSVAVLALTAELVGFNWSAFFEAKWAPVIIIGINLLNIFLRWVTTTPWGQPK
jgi:hypothetical protein